MTRIDEKKVKRRDKTLSMGYSTFFLLAVAHRGTGLAFASFQTSSRLSPTVTMAMWVLPGLPL